jgi:hypothetical protein
VKISAFFQLNGSSLFSVEYHNLALLTNGTVFGWGSNSNGQTTIPSDLTNANAATAIAAGELFSLALRANGTVEAWGDNTYGQTNVPSGLSNIVAIAAGGRHCLALQSNGMVVAWGDDDLDQTNVPTGMSNVMAIAAGDSHSFALINDGTLVAWGDNTNGQTNIPYFSTNNLFKQIPAGQNPISLEGYVPTNIVIRLIAAGGNNSLVAVFSPLVQYPVDVSKDVLLIYNATSADSSNVCAYYVANRPMMSSANVLGINYNQNEDIWQYEFTDIYALIQTWLTTNPTIRPSYAILFQDMASTPGNKLSNRALHVPMGIERDWFGPLESVRYQHQHEWHRRDERLHRLHKQAGKHGQQ